MKKLFAILLALALGMMPILAQAEENMLVQNNNGCVYVNGKVYVLSQGEGLYEFDGTQKRMVAEYYAVSNSGLITDGKTAYVLEPFEGCMYLVAIDVASGAGEVFAELPDKGCRLVGITEGKLIYRAEGEEGEYDLYVQDMDSVCGDGLVFANLVGNTMFWRGTSLFHQMQYDVYPVEFLAAEYMNGGLAIMDVHPCILQAKVNHDGVYYWGTNAMEPMGDFSSIALYHTDGNTTSCILDVSVPTNGAMPNKIMSDYIVVTCFDPYEMLIVNFRTGEGAKCTNTALIGNYFYQDEVTGQLYYHDVAAKTLYLSDIGGNLTELGSFDEAVDILLIVDGVAYCRIKGTGIAEAVRLG